MTDEFYFSHGELGDDESLEILEIDDIDGWDEFEGWHLTLDFSGRGVMTWDICDIVFICLHCGNPLANCTC